MTESTVTAASSPNRGVKRGLPPTGLATAEASASALWESARLGLVSKDAAAAALGHRHAAGGGWAQKSALLRGFKLLRFEDEQIGLSELGQQIVNDSDLGKQMAARRTALMSLQAYRELVNAFAGSPAPERAALATRLRFEYGKTQDIAEAAAQAFLDSLVHAGMVDAEGVIRPHGVGVVSGGEESPAITQETVTEEQRDAEEIDAAFDEVEEPESGTEDGGADFGRIGSATSVSLNMTLDLSKYRADEVVEILKVLGLSARA